jgi:hypothetical protein
VIHVTHEPGARRATLTPTPHKQKAGQDVGACEHRRTEHAQAIYAALKRLHGTIDREDANQNQQTRDQRDG